MGNQGSFMEKVYLYLPVLLCHSNMDYSDKTTMWNIRVAYFAEQVSFVSLGGGFIVGSAAWARRMLHCSSHHCSSVPTRVQGGSGCGK